MFLNELATEIVDNLRGIDLASVIFEMHPNLILRLFALLTLLPQTKPVGTAGSATPRALGLAARNLRHRFGSDDSCAGGLDRRPGGRQRWFHLRR